MLAQGVICRPYIRLKDGRVIWAKQYGKKAFFFVPKKEEIAQESDSSENKNQ